MRIKIHNGMKFQAKHDWALHMLSANYCSMEEDGDEWDEYLNSLYLTFLGFIEIELCWNKNPNYKKEPKIKLCKKHKWKDSQIIKQCEQCQCVQFVDIVEKKGK